MSNFWPTVYILTTCPTFETGSGIHCNGIHCMAVDGTAPDPVPGKAQGSRSGLHYNLVNTQNHQEVKTMPKCATCGAELEPPVRVPHTVYVKSLYHIAGQNYCRHHVIRAAVAAGVIAQVRPGAGPVATVSRE